MIQAALTPSEQSLSRVKAWLAAELAADKDRRNEIAKVAGLDEKTLRLAVGGPWDPRVSTLRKLELIMPPKSRKRARAA